MQTIDLSNAPWHFKAIKLAGLEYELRRNPDSCTYVKLLGVAAFRLIVIPAFLITMVAMLIWMGTSVVTSMMKGASLKDAVELFFDVIRGLEAHGVLGVAAKIVIVLALFADILVLAVAISIGLVFGGFSVMLNMGKLDKYLSNGPDAEPSAMAKLYQSWRDKFCVQLKLPAER